MIEIRNDPMLEDTGVQLEGGYIKNNNLTLNLFWLGFMIYIVSYAVSSTNQVSFIIVNLFQVFGLGLLFPSAALLMKFKIENSYLKILFIIYILWLITVVFRGIKFDYDSMKQMLFNPMRGGLHYLVPMVILFPLSYSLFKKLFGVIIILGFFFLMFSLLFYKELLFPSNYYLSQGIFENFSQHLSFSIGFVMLTYIYHSKSRNLFSLFVMALTFLLAVIRARRGMIFMSFNILFFSYLIYQTVNKTKVLNIVLSGFVVIMMVYGAIRIYENNRKDTFSLITERIGDDTRTEVETYFFRAFELKDWIIGRGMNGQYFCPGVQDGEGRISIYRGVIETGFLQIVLNGGLISLCLFLLISVPALFKGIFQSKNLLSKAAGIWILLFLIYSYPGTPAIFSLNYILVWLSIGIGYSGEIRNLSDEEIMQNIRQDRKSISPDLHE